MTKMSSPRIGRHEQSASKALRESAVGAACEQILRPISQHFLDLGVGISQFLHVAKITYVQAAAAAIRNSGQRPTVSRVAAITGLQRKEISHLISPPKGAPVFSVREPPTMRVVSAWRSSAEYRDARGKPRSLQIEGTHSFRQLVETHAGDVTHVALLRELERLDWVRRTPEGLVSLNATPADLKRKHAESQVLALRLADFASAIVSSSRSIGLEHYAGFRESRPTDPRVGAALSRAFSRRAEEFLESFDRWVSRSVRSNGAVPTDATQFGIGIYLIERKPAKAPEEGRPTKRPRATRRAKRA